jgi:hypothetical protein
MVRLEIEAALERGIRVIPVLVDGAAMPGAVQLPSSLSRLANRQAVELSPMRFSSDARRLTNLLEKVLAPAPAPTTTTTAEPSSDTGVPDPVEAKLRTASADDQLWLRRFIQEQVRLRGAEVVAGPRDLKYLRLTLPGARRRAAYCYVTTRGYVDFRLPKAAAQGCRYSYARDLSDDDETHCAVRLRLNSEETLAEALQLATEAAAAIQGTSEEGRSSPAHSVSGTPEGELSDVWDPLPKITIQESGHVENWKLILAAAQALTAAGQAPFTRQSVYEWIWRRHPRAAHDRPSLDPTFQGMVSNATGGPRSAGGTPLLRTSRGFYVLAQPPAGGQT